MRAGAVFVPLAAVLAGLWMGPARADLATAHEDFVAKRYDKALPEYKELAELGNGVAQFALALMYHDGLGTHVSMTSAYAWALLAQENGIAQARSVVEELQPQLSPVSLKIAGEIHDQYARAALEKRLMPEVLMSGDDPNHQSCRILHAYVPAYPAEASLRGIEGGVYVEATVTPDGHAHHPRVTYELPQGQNFGATARTSMLRTLFSTGHDASGKPASCTITVYFQFIWNGSGDYPRLNQLAEKTFKKAAGGEVGAQVLYGMLLDGLPQLAAHRNQALTWFTMAAQAGSPFAQYRVGTQMLNGRACHCDERKAAIWLERAASADEPDAQVTIAGYLLRGDPKPEDIKRAGDWLERAAAHGNNDAKLYLAALLAAAPVADMRDPKRALELLDGLRHLYAEDPSSWEIRASAEANLGDFKAAVRDESSALSHARSLQWDTKPLEERLELYKSRQPFEGTLLEF